MSGRKAISNNTESQLVKSKNPLDEEFEDEFDELCDDGAVGQEEVHAQPIRDSCWESLKCDSLSDSSTRSRKRASHQRQKTKTALDENVYGIYGRQRRPNEDDLEERASSNSVKRSLKK